MAGQAIRPSQFITTYGPGAILEGTDGPKIISNIEHSAILNHIDLAKLEIVDQRLSQSLLKGAAILRLPTNAELNIADSKAVYETVQFPSWSLCVEHNKLYRYEYGKTVDCPKCKRKDNSYEAWIKSRKEAIRFVMACPNGHLDDVNWIGLIKHSKKCRPSYLNWEGGGGALKNVHITCPECGQKFNLGDAYSRRLNCSGRFPESKERGNECERDAKMMQRGAANLRIAELVTSLTIPPRDTRLHKILGQTNIQTVLLMSGKEIFDKQSLLNKLKPLVNRTIPAHFIDKISRYSNDAIMEAIKDVCEESEQCNEYQYHVREFDELQEAARRGAPVIASSTPGAPPLFEVIKNHVKTFSGPRGNNLRVTPVSRLQVVMVQVGYKRIDPVESIKVSTHHYDGIKEWYPGVEMFGEGIFIDLAPNAAGEDSEHFNLDGTEYEQWLKAYKTPKEFFAKEGLFDPEHVHPVFVWWHTFAHRLINALSIDSGYSSASIRERVYVSIDKDNSAKARGGILLYTTQAGGDGTLGGLIALVPKFDSILHSALKRIDTCSNDPLCGEEEFDPGKYNGAACYACQLISETSCEHRNMLLDRNFLAKNLP